MPTFQPHTFDDATILTMLLFAPLFGACVGSFVNVCVYRLPREHLSIALPGSHCFSCGTPLPWYENIPLLSYIALGGKCSHCRTSLSPIYLGTEVTLAVVYGWTTWAFLTFRHGFDRFDPRFMAAGVVTPVGPFEQLAVLILTLILLSALLCASWIDMRHRIIPDEISMRGAAMVPLLAYAFPAILPDEVFVGWVADRRGDALLTALTGAAVGAGGIWLIGAVGKRVFGKEAMGMGDVKLMALLGGVLGWQGVSVAFFLACFLGASIGGGALLGAVLWKLITGRGQPDHYMPFGPYLAGGAVAVLLFRPELVQLGEWWFEVASRP